MDQNPAGEGGELKQVSEVQWKSLLSEVTPYKEEKHQMANWQSVLLCQNECVRRRRKVESDERKEIRSDLIWKPQELSEDEEEFG